MPVSGAIGSSEIADQTTQRCDIVNIVPDRQRVHAQPDLGGAVQGLPKHPIGAPRDVLEQTAMWAFEADQVIAAIFGASDNDPVAGHCERSGGFDKHRSRQIGAVGVDKACRAIAGGEQVGGGVEEARAEADPARRQQPDPAGTTPANTSAEPGGE